MGMCSAYYLLREGKSVTIYDTGKSIHSPCSYGNAGMVVPSHFIPLAAPGMVEKGFKMMWNKESPFAIKPRLNSELIRWCYLFMRHCSDKHVEEVAMLTPKHYFQWQNGH